MMRFFYHCGWQEANGFFEQVLNENVEEPRAYIGKLCAEYEVQGEEKLSALQKDFTASENYKMACRFGGADVEKRLFTYNQQGLYDAAMRSMQAAKSSADYQAVKSRFVALGDFGDAAQKAEECSQKMAEIQEQEAYDRKLTIYLTAEKLMKNGTQHDLEEAADKFRSLSGFKDADELREKCLAKVREIKSQEEQERQRQQEAAAKKKKLTFIGTASAAAVAALALVTVFVIVPNVKYSKANGMLESGNYAEAEQAFSALGDFKDSADKVTEAKYGSAVELFENGNLDDAQAILENLGDYAPAKEILTEISNERKKPVYDLIDAGKYDEAAELCQSIGNDDLLKETRIAQVAAIAKVGSFYDAADCYREYLKGDNVSFKQIMIDNGMSEQINEYEEILLGCEGTYNCIAASRDWENYKYTTIYVTVDKDNWIIDVSDFPYNWTRKFPFENEMRLKVMDRDYNILLQTYTKCYWESGEKVTITYKKETQ